MLKIKHLCSWDANAGPPLMRRLASQILKPQPTHCVRGGLVFETLKGYLPDFFDVLCYDKI